MSQLLGSRTKLTACRFMGNAVRQFHPVVSSRTEECSFGEGVKTVKIFVQPNFSEGTYSEGGLLQDHLKATTQASSSTDVRTCLLGARVAYSDAGPCSVQIDVVTSSPGRGHVKRVTGSQCRRAPYDMIAQSAGVRDERLSV